MPHWPGLSVCSGRIAGGTGNDCPAGGPAMVVVATLMSLLPLVATSWKLPSR